MQFVVVFGYRVLGVFSCSFFSCYQLLHYQASIKRFNFSQNYIRHFSHLFNLFHATGFFLYPLKTLENLRFPFVFRGFRKRPLA